ncbi:MAG: SET domain-containing protein [Alphaproteobacteria bacterium]|jgi:SET domain-containing protein
MMLVKNYLGLSDIHGIGLFAGEFIKKGQKIWEFIPGLDVELPKSALDSPHESIRSFLQRYTYPHPQDSGKVILDGDHGRFMNHSAHPNSDFRIPAIGLALVDIAEGSEITCNYDEFDPGFDLSH